jgi:hypothetical protein
MDEVSPDRVRLSAAQSAGSDVASRLIVRRKALRFSALQATRP